MKNADTPATPPRVHGPHLMVLLLGMAVLPMVFVGWIALAEYGDVEGARAVADEASDTADDIALLSELRLNLVDEQSWFAALTAARDLGVPLELVDQVVGVNILEEYELAGSLADALTDREPGLRYRDEIESIRAIGETSGAVAGTRYRDLIRSLGEVTDDLRERLEDQVGDVPRGAEIVQASRVAGAANAARFAYVRHVWAYFEAELGTLVDAAPSYVALVEYRNQMRQELDLIGRKVEPDSPVAAAHAAVRNERNAAVFARAVDEAVVVLFDPASTARTGDVIVRMTELADVFAAGVAASDSFDALTDAAAAEMEEASADVVVAAEGQFMTAILFVVALAALSLGTAVALARYIGRPMIELASAAESLGTGVDIEVATSGPSQVRQLGAALSDASSNLVRMERLEHEATHDALTGVPSRRLVRQHLRQALERARRSGQAAAVMFVDVDEFKKINDAYGHATGDRVLRVVCDRIHGQLRENDLIGRYGGDEFIVVVESVTSAEGADRLADRIVASMSDPIELDWSGNDGAPSEVSVSVSVGVTVLSPIDVEIDEVLARADAATYEAKATGRNRAIAATAPSVLDPSTVRERMAWSATSPSTRGDPPARPTPWPDAASRQDRVKNAAGERAGGRVRERSEQMKVAAWPAPTGAPRSGDR